MRTLAISLILACFVQTALARMPATAIVRSTSELVLRNNSFAVELLRIVASNKTPQWNPTLLNSIPNFASATEEGYIPTITEREELLIELEKFDLKDIDVAELRSAYDEAVEQGLGSALRNGTALEIADNVSEEYAEAVSSYASYLADVIQEEGIKAIPAEIVGIMKDEGLRSSPEGGSLLPEEGIGHPAVETGNAVEELYVQYTQEVEAAEVDTEVENTEPGELTTSTSEKLPAAAMEFGLLLKEVIVRSSLAQKEFCAKLGISISACWDYVTFQRVPRLNTLSSKIIPALTSLGVDEKAVRSAWERADAAFTEVEAKKSTPTETAPTDSVPAEELEADGLTMKQLISKYREFLQQMELQQQRGEVSEAMVQIVRADLTDLEELLANQAEAIAQLKNRMALENIGWEEIAKYRATGQASRFSLLKLGEISISVKDIIAEVSSDPQHADMYVLLLAKLAENSEQAEFLLEQYLSGERALSEEELLQVCAHTACTVGVRPMLAVERVLDVYKESIDKIGVTDELSKEELEVLVAALAVYQGKYQVTAEVQEEVVPTVQEEVAPPVQEEVVPTVQEQTAQEKAVVEAEAEASSEAEKERAAKRKAEEERKAEAARQAKQNAQKDNKDKKAQADEEREQKEKEAIYGPIVSNFVEINNQVLQDRKSIDNTTKLIQALKEIGFDKPKGQSGGSHIMMITKKEEIRLSVGGQKSSLKARFVAIVLKQAKSIRFREDLQAWEVAVKGTWKDKRQALLDYVDVKLADAGENTQEREELEKLTKSLNEMDSYLKQAEQGTQ